MYSPALAAGSGPTTVDSPRRPRTWARRTAKPVSGLWNVIRSIRAVTVCAMRAILPARRESARPVGPAPCGAYRTCSRLARGRREVRLEGVGFARQLAPGALLLGGEVLAPPLLVRLLVVAVGLRRLLAVSSGH